MPTSWTQDPNHHARIQEFLSGKGGGGGGVQTRGQEISPVNLFFFNLTEGVQWFYYFSKDPEGVQHFPFGGGGVQHFPGVGGGPNANFYRNPYNL